MCLLTKYMDVFNATSVVMTWPKSFLREVFVSGIQTSAIEPIHQRCRKQTAVVFEPDEPKNY